MLIISILQFSLYACKKTDTNVRLPIAEPPPLKYLSEVQDLNDTMKHQYIYYDSLMNMTEMDVYFRAGATEVGSYFLKGGYINNQLVYLYSAETKDFARAVTGYEVLYNQSGNPQKVMFKGNTSGPTVAVNYDSLVYDNASRLVKLYNAEWLFDKTIRYVGKHELTYDADGNITDVLYGNPAADLSKNFIEKRHYTYDKHHNPYHIPRDYLFWLYFHISDFSVLSRHNAIKKEVWYSDYFGQQKQTIDIQFTYDEDGYPAQNYYSFTSSQGDSTSYPGSKYQFIRQ